MNTNDETVNNSTVTDDQGTTNKHETTKNKNTETINKRTVNTKLHYRPVHDMNVLYEGFKSSMKGSAWKKEPQQFEWNLLHSLNNLSNSLKDRTYKTSDGVEFILHERGRIRHIHGNTMADRVVRHALCDEILNPALQKYLIHNNGASQKGKGLSFSRKLFERDLHNFYLEYGDNKGYVGIVDFSKFYDNIQHEKVKDLINPKIDEESQWLLAEIIRHFEVDLSHLSDEEFKEYVNQKFESLKYYEETKDIKKTGEKMMQKSVDIGDQVSQTIGVFFPTRVDNYVKIVRGQKRYGRYMDDMYVICRTKEEVRSVFEGIQGCAQDLGLYINTKKTHVYKLENSFKFLQIKYYLDEKGRVVKRINPDSVTRERTRLKKLKGLLERGEIEYADIKNAYKSWMGNFASLMSKRQVKNMKKLYFDLFGEDVRWKKLK